MKIALIGYGKMGQMIEQIAISKGHQIVVAIKSDSTQQDWNLLRNADVAIEFTKPDIAMQNIFKCFDANVPVVVGTTGWYQHLEEVKLRCISEKQTILTATNFSIGVNLFFHLNKVLAKLMENLPEYSVKMEEIHHTKKLDAPSGTAITLAEGILAELSRKNNWKLGSESSLENEIAINAIRKDEVPGTHSITYTSAIDDIEIKHTAHSRAGFASGAVIAAEWLHGKKGVFTMNDLIGF